MSRSLDKPSCKTHLDSSSPHATSLGRSPIRLKQSSMLALNSLVNLFGMPLRLPASLLPFANLGRGMVASLLRHFDGSSILITNDSANVADDRVQPAQLIRIGMKMLRHPRIALGSLQRIKSETKPAPTFSSGHKQTKSHNPVQVLSAEPLIAKTSNNRIRTADFSARGYPP